jgi:hypothetical protein
MWSSGSVRKRTLTKFCGANFRLERGPCPRSFMTEKVLFKESKLSPHTISAFCPRIANFHVGKFQVGKGTLSPLFMVQTLFFKQPKLSRTSIEMRCGRRKGNSQ